jgi:hypothetical protein
MGQVAEVDVEVRVARLESPPGLRHYASKILRREFGWCV